MSAVNHPESKPMNPRYPRGSEWRKWDLHIHAPGTKKNDQYHLEEGDVWDDFCARIENSEVQAFGITDYFSADCYFEFVQQFRAMYPNSQKVFFPNIELSTNDVVNKAAEEVNLHVVFNSFVPGSEESIKKFLRNLKTNKTAAGARNVTASELSTLHDFEEATTTRRFISEAFVATFGDKVDLTEYLLIFTAANNDGIRTETEVVDGKTRGKKRKALITDELDKFSHGFFGSSSNTDYFLDKDRLEGKEETIPKPVVSGSDAHSFQDLDTCLGKLVINDGQVLKQPTWIKADLTYEGLRQIIFEPKERVFIGEEPEIEIRVRNNPTKYIKTLQISSVAGYTGRLGKWFDKEKIEFNKELVAIIGNKGSGKSALTDIEGLLGNSHNQKHPGPEGRPEELFSFLNHQKFLRNGHASNFEAELKFYEADPLRRSLDQSTDESVPERVEYLPQKYLEKICANIEDDEFRGKLNEVIFGYVEERTRFGKRDFESLIEYLTNQTEHDIVAAKELLHEKNIQIVSIERKLTEDYKKEIEEKLKIKQSEVDAHDKNKPLEVSKPIEGSGPSSKDESELADIKEKLGKLRTEIGELENEQVRLGKEVEDLKQAKLTIQRGIEDLRKLKTKFKVLFEQTGIVFDDVVSISTDFKKVDDAKSDREKRLGEIDKSLITDDAIEALELEGAALQTVKKESRRSQLNQLQVREEEIVAKLGKPQKDYQEYLKQKETWDKRRLDLVGAITNAVSETLEGLKLETENITKKYAGELKTARSERLEIVKTMFTKKEGLISFYDSVKTSIDKKIELHSSDLGDYAISIEAGLRFVPFFYEEFFKHINQSVKGSFYSSEAGKSVLKVLCDNHSNWNELENVAQFLEDVIKHLDEDQRKEVPPGENKARSIFRQMKLHKDPIEFYDYLFGLEYLQPKYDLKVDKKDLSELSPGERGGLLLIFYLMLDQRDIPLIIDQPEDNLDNKSVYEILVTFLKEAKKKRQIIMVTHNPNLAVVADAEQIIHVAIDKKNKNDFDFISGSIENEEINKRVVDILEGTMPAFDNRRLKYRRGKQSFASREK